MNFRTPLPSSFSGPMTVADAQRLGVTPGQLRNPSLGRPFHGVRSPPDCEPTIRTLASAYRPLLPEGGVFSHTTAAMLHDMPLPAYARRTALHVTSPAEIRAREGNGVHGHHLALSADEMVLIDGLPCTSAARTWCDLAPMLGFLDLVAAGDRLLWYECPMVEMSTLVRAVDQAAGRRGVVALRAALPMLSNRAQSPKESRTRLIIENSRLPAIAANIEIGIARTGRLLRVDLGFERFRLALEYEGDHHRTDRGQWRKDIRRVEDLAEEGWETMRITDDDLADEHELVERIARRLTARGWSDPWSTR